MKSLTIFLMLITILSAVQCTRSDGTPAGQIEASVEPPTFIEKDQANRMIQSYLTSINYPERDQELRAIAYDADSLRAYLKDSSIRYIKLMVAHRMDYIQSGGEGRVPPPGTFGVTGILVGVSAGNSYVYKRGLGERVLDNGMPCPDMCKRAGQTPYPILK